MRSFLRRSAHPLRGAALVAALLLGCDGGASTNASPKPESSATSSAPIEPTSSAGAPENGNNAAKILNPRGLPAYQGPTATVRGRVTIAGDAPPDVPFYAESECTRAPSMYGKLFRKNAQGELADAMVAVTKYNGFVPAATPVRTVEVSGCAFESRTIVATFGQRIDVLNKDPITSYMPYLDGAPFRAMLVAIPNGRPVTLQAYEPGHYLLRDVLPRPFEIADVFVVPYSTFDVTTEQGAFTIGSVPVGHARIDAFIPILNKSVGKDLDLVEGVNEVNLELTYDQSKDKPVAVPAPVWGDRARPTASH